MKSPSLIVLTICATAASSVGPTRISAEQTSAEGGRQAGAAARPSNHQFLTDAAQGGEAEVELGKVAQEKAADARVKAFGQRMVTDHSKANAELRAIIVKKGITIPGGMGPHTAMKASLEKLQGAKFDEAYMKAMVADHQKDIAAFENARKSTDSDIKAFAERTLPTLKAHLQMAQDTQKSVAEAPVTAPATSPSSPGTAAGTSGASPTGTAK